MDIKQKCTLTILMQESRRPQRTTAGDRNDIPRWSSQNIACTMEEYVSSGVPKCKVEVALQEKEGNLHTYLVSRGDVITMGRIPVPGYEECRVPRHSLFPGARSPFCHLFFSRHNSQVPLTRWKLRKLERTVGPVNGGRLKAGRRFCHLWLAF